MESEKRENSLPEGYRMTELGLLPEEWRVVRLGEVAEYINGYAFKPDQWSKHGRPIIRIQNLTGSSSESNYFEGEIDQRYLVMPGDLLISWSASLDAFIWRGPEAWLNQHIFKVTNLRGTDKLFLFFALKSVIATIKAKTRGSTMKHITKKEFKATHIPLPPLPEQRAIAHVLRAVQEAKEATERVIAAARELKKSLMRHLFTYGPVPVNQTDRVPMQETEIGPLPAHWRVVRLEEVVTIHDRKRVPLNAEQRKSMRGKYPYCGANGILDYINDYLFDGEFILLAEDGGYWGPYQDSAYIMRGKFWVNNHAHVIQAIPSKSDNTFLMYMLNFLDIERFISGTTRGKLNQGVMKSIPIPLPPLEEQQEIARMLQAVDEKIRAEQERKRALEQLFKTLLHDLMTAKRRLPKTFVQIFKGGEV